MSQTLTLYVTPVFYIYMEKLQDWLKRRRKVRAPEVVVTHLQAPHTVDH